MQLPPEIRGVWRFGLNGRVLTEGGARPFPLKGRRYAGGEVDVQGVEKYRG